MNQYTLLRIKERLNKELCDTLKDYIAIDETMAREEQIQKISVLKELIKGIHMPSFCDEEGRCDAIDNCSAIDANECSCCIVNRVVNAFNIGIEFQKKKSSWISVKDDLPCNHKELISPDDKRDTKYVVALIHGYIVLSRMYKLDGKWHWENDKPTHLFSIPELPKE